MLTRIDSRLVDDLGDDPRPRAVVIGAGFGGLSSAMRLGAKGYRVDVLDRLDGPGGRGSCLNVGGHRFDLGPTIITAPDVFRRLWAECGQNFDTDVDLRPLDPFYEIRWQDGSALSVRADAQEMLDEIRRFAPADVEGYQRFMADSERRYWFGFEGLGRRSMHKLWDLIKVLPTFGMLRADRSVYAHAARRVKDERLRMALSFHPLFIGGDPFHVTSMYILVSYLEKEFGVHYAVGGAAALARAMTGVIEKQGGAVHFNAEVDEILTDGDRVTGVRTVSGAEIATNTVVSNADIGHTYTRLLRGRRKRRWSKSRLKRTRWSMSLYVWYFGTKGTADMWSDVGHHTILNGPRYRDLVKDIFIKGHLAEDMSLYIHRPSVSDPTCAPEGDDTFYALSPVPHLDFDNGVDWDVESEPYRQRMLAMLEKIMPGIGERVTESRVFTPVDFRDRYLSPHGCGFSIEPRIFQSAWFRPHNVSEEIPGLWLAGAGTHPGAGLPAVVASSEVLAQLVPDVETVR